MTENCAENINSIPDRNSPKFSGNFPTRFSRKRDGKLPAQLQISHQSLISKCFADHLQYNPDVISLLGNIFDAKYECIKTKREKDFCPEAYIRSSIFFSKSIRFWLFMYWTKLLFRVVFQIKMYVYPGQWFLTKYSVNFRRKSLRKLPVSGRNSSVSARNSTQEFSDHIRLPFLISFCRFQAEPDKPGHQIHSLKYHGTGRFLAQLSDLGNCKMRDKKEKFQKLIHFYKQLSFLFHFVFWEWEKVLLSLL